MKLRELANSFRFSGLRAIQFGVTRSAGQFQPRRKDAVWLGLWLLVGLGPQITAQTVSPVPPTTTSSVGLYFSPSQITGVLRQQFVSLGSRLQQPGNERITMTGSLTDSTGANPVQVVI
jgi:hypothetical protein